MCKQVQLVSLCHLSSSGGVGWMMTDVGVEGSTASAAELHDGGG